MRRPASTPAPPLARSGEVALAITRSGRSLIVKLPVRSRIASWAVVGGGLGYTRQVVWMQVVEQDLLPPIDARDVARARLAELGIDEAVVFLTSRDLDGYVVEQRSSEGLAVHCVATTGLYNALRAGDPPGVGPLAGTINILCWCSAPLTDGALIEAVSIVAEARAAALIDAAVPSRRSGRPATGTGTDCIAVAAPVEGEPVEFVGKHTLAGHLIGSAVEHAMQRSVADWTAEALARQELGAS